jgi:hypothetical protein
VTSDNGNFSLLRSGYGALQCLDWLRVGVTRRLAAPGASRGRQANARLQGPCPLTTWCIAQIAERACGSWAFGLRRLPSPQHHRSRCPHTTAEPLRACMGPALWSPGDAVVGPWKPATFPPQHAGPEADPATQLKVVATGQLAPGCCSTTTQTAEADIESWNKQPPTPSTPLHAPHCPVAVNIAVTCLDNHVVVDDCPSAQTCTSLILPLLSADWALSRLAVRGRRQGWACHLPLLRWSSAASSTP